MNVTPLPNTGLLLRIINSDGRLSGENPTLSISLYLFWHFAISSIGGSNYQNQQHAGGIAGMYFLLVLFTLSLSRVCMCVCVFVYLRHHPLTKQKKRPEI